MPSVGMGAEDAYEHMLKHFKREGHKVLLHQVIISGSPCIVIYCTQNEYHLKGFRNAHIYSGNLPAWLYLRLLCLVEPNKYEICSNSVVQDFGLLASIANGLVRHPEQVIS